MFSSRKPDVYLSADLDNAREELEKYLKLEQVVTVIRKNSPHTPELVRRPATAKRFTINPDKHVKSKKIIDSLEKRVDSESKFHIKDKFVQRKSTRHLHYKSKTDELMAAVSVMISPKNYKRARTSMNSNAESPNLSSASPHKRIRRSTRSSARSRVLRSKYRGISL